MTPDEKHTYAVAGMLAAIECARIMDRTVSGEIDPAAAQEGMELIRADAIRGHLDIMGAQATIAVRAANLACQASAAAGLPMTVREFLDDMEADLTPPDSPAGAIPPGPAS